MFLNFIVKKRRLFIILKLNIVCPTAQLKATDKSQDAAGFLASKFVTRPDIRESALPAFIDWALSSALTGNNH